MAFLLISNTTALPQKLPFRNYLEKNGLPSAIAFRILQDSKGYIWICTDNGLSRFDGITFETFKKENGLTDNKINAILEDREGNIWIGTDRGGVDCFTPGGIINYTDQIGLNDGGVFSIAEDAEDREGKLWFGTSKGLFCFDGKKFQHFAPEDVLHTNLIFAVAVGKRGKLWIGTGSGLGYRENENFIDYTTENGLTHDSVSTLLIDSGGSLWFGTKAGLYRSSDGKLTRYTKQDGLIHNFVTAIMEDAGGNIWIGTWNGISLFSGGKFFNFGTENGLPNHLVYCILQDSEGNIWFGTHSGISCLPSLNVKTFTREEGLSDELILDIIQDKKGRYWFGTSDGLNCYSHGSFKNFTTKDGLIDNTVNALMEDRRGNIWIGTTQGISIFSSGSFTNYTRKEGLSSNIVFKLFESQNGTIWIGNRNGLNRFRNGEILLPPFKADLENTLCIIEDAGGKLWVSSRDELYVYSGGRLTSFSNRDGLSGNTVRALFEDSKGRIWIGTEGGVSCFDGEAFTLYSNRNSTLVDDACFFILEDARGNLWFGNSRGLTRFNGKRFKTYTSERLGLTDRSWFTGTADNLGVLWFGSTEGVTCFYPPPVKIIASPPPVYITGVKSMEKEIAMSESGLFQYDQNIFRFNFVGISFCVPAGVRYKYLLEGIDEEWQFTDNRSLFYPFLPPGSYNLKVKAVNIDGVESRTPANYKFKILPPFWQRWWFLGLTGLAICLMVVLAIQMRVKRVKEKAELTAKNRQLVMSQRMELMGTLAAGTVHDLKNLMAVIIGYSQVMGQKYQGDNEDDQNIEIIKDTAATAMQMSKQILSFARPKDFPQQETVDLRLSLAEILDTLKITHFKAIQVQWEPPPEPVLFSIHPARFQQLVMNLCLNACQAMPTNGTLGVVLSRTPGKEIILEITDTGTGIKKENLEKIFEPLFTTKEQDKGTGLGLFVVKQVVNEYNGKIEVHSEPGQGTTFVIRFPDD